jgi:two-component system osmolarity sensor histidine kinase EnvZ
MFPIARQAAGNLAALMVLSAQTWAELPPDTRADFEDELKNYHGLILVKRETQIKPARIKTPFMLFLENSLQQRLEKRVDILEDPLEPSQLWVDISMGIHDLRVGFTKDKVGPNPPLAFFILLLGAALFVLVTSTLLVRRLIRPLQDLALAARQIGQGKKLEPLRENGPEELVMLAKSFNQMNQQVQELLANRTTLFAGISHDLRTPISRITLALEFLDNEQEAELIKGIKKDLTEMNQMISQTLEIARGFDNDDSKAEFVELDKLFSSMVAEYQSDIQQIEWEPGPSCTTLIVEMALRRVLANLMENAIRYGEGKMVTIQMDCKDNKVNIRIMDRGLGIPQQRREAVFQPFYRLESSRNSQTGGSGLGLAIVRQLCDKYGWIISIDSRQGGGTVISLTIDH